MAYFSQKPTENKPKSSPFGFDIDEQGHSSQSRQRGSPSHDNTMINIGEHCTLYICNQLDILPSKCDYCNLTFCRQHNHPEQHHCTEYLADLTTSPLCEKCNEYIKIPIDRCKNRTIYNQIIAEHVASGCIQHSFKRTQEEKDRIKQSLLCAAEYCNNHTSSGKKLSTTICQDCNQQVCLSHRFAEYHQCPSLLRDHKRDEIEKAKKDAFQQKVFDKICPQLATNDTTIPNNSTTDQLKHLQQQVHQRAIEKCKNPYVLNRQTQQQAQVQAKLQEQTIKRQSSMSNNDNNTPDIEPIFIPKSVTTIPTRGTLIIHPQIQLPNVKTALMQAKPKTKNPANATIPNDNKIYAIIYFPQTKVTSPTKSPPSLSVGHDNLNSIPFSTQDNLLTFNQQQYHHDEVLNLLKEENPDNTLFTTDVFVQQCLGDPTNHNINILQNNIKMQSPLYIAFDRFWTIKQCIDEITRCVNLSPYENMLKLSKGQVMYTLSMLSFPIANFTPSLQLDQIITQFEFDFNLETEMIQEETDLLLANNNNTNGNNKANVKSATHRLNTTFLPLHLAFGWYVDVVK